VSPRYEGGSPLFIGPFDFCKLSNFLSGREGVWIARL
jgi:hypothetical protein